MSQKVDLSFKSLVTTTVFLLGLFVLYYVRDILFTLFISITLVAALNPIVEQIERRNISRPLAILFVYLFIIAIFGVLVGAIANPLIYQTRKLIDLLPSSISQIDFLSNHQEEITSQVLSQLGAVPENVIRIVLNVFSNIFSVLTTLVITFYLLLEKPKLGNYLSYLFGKKSTKAKAIIDEVETSLGSWVRGELVLMFTIGLSTYLGLFLLGVDNALPLAIIAGILEILPNIGPVISAVPAVLIAASIHPLIAVGTLILYILIQLVENHFLVPRVMEHAVGISPIIIILALMIGNRLAGPLGAILAIPVFLVCRAIAKHLLIK